MDNTPFPLPQRLGPLLANRRAQPRQACSLEVSCQPITAKGCDLWWLAEIKDMSTSGVGMLSTRSFERGTFVAIQLANLATAFCKTAVARVVHVVPSGDKWFVGCAFQTPLDADDMTAMAATPAVG
jgi:hypothetical protein